MNNKSQVFSTDIVVAVTIFLFILITSAWFWDTTKEKIHITETRNDMEIVAHNAVSVLMTTVGDPPNWYNITFSDEDVYSIGIGKNRPWMIDEGKATAIGTLNSTNYTLIKKMLGIRGSSYEFFLNISKYNSTSNSFNNITITGKKPNATAAHVVNVRRFALSDYDWAWVSFNMQIWDNCEGAQC